MFPMFPLLLLGRLLLWLWVSDHDTHARVRARHFSVLLKQACILDLRVAIPELVLGLVI